MENMSCVHRALFMNENKKNVSLQELPAFGVFLVEIHRKFSSDRRFFLPSDVLENIFIEYNHLTLTWYQMVCLHLNENFKRKFLAIEHFGCINTYIAVASEHNNFCLVRWLIAYGTRHHLSFTTDRLFMDACYHGNVEAVEWIYTHYSETICPQEKYIDAAARGGHLEVIEWLYSKNLRECTDAAMERAANGGYLRVVKWLHVNFPMMMCSEWAMNYVAYNGHLHILIWFHIHRKEVYNCYVMDYAAMSGHLDVLVWLHKIQKKGRKKTAIDEIAIKNATHYDHLNWTTNAMDLAAEHGHLEVVDWLHKNRPEGCTTHAMDWAAAHGHLEVVKWLHENRSEGCTTTAMDWAARNGHLEIVKFLHYNQTEGCTYRAMDFAAYRGHLEIVKFLHYNRTEGCTTDAMDFAALCGHFEIVKFLHYNRTEGCTPLAMKFAGLHCFADIVEWLHENRHEGNILDTIDDIYIKLEDSHEYFFYLYKNGTSRRRKSVFNLNQALPLDVADFVDVNCKDVDAALLTYIKKKGELQISAFLRRMQKYC